MTASIRFDGSPGPLEVAAGAVALSNSDNTGLLGWHWELLDRPIGSSAAISSAFIAAPSVTTDVPGSYRVRLRTYTDAGRTVLDESSIEITYVLFAAPYPWRIPAAGETTEVGTRGWAEAIEEILRDLRTTIGTPAAASQAEVDAGTVADEYVSPATLAGIAPRAPVTLDNPATGTYTISDTAIEAETDLPIGTDLVIDQEDADSDYMIYAIGTARSGSICQVAIWAGQTCEFDGTAASVTLEAMASPSLEATLAMMDATGPHATGRTCILQWIRTDYVYVIGGDIA